MNEGQDLPDDVCCKRCAAAAVLAAVLVIVVGCLYEYYHTVQENQLKDELRLAAYAVENSGKDYLEGLTSRDCRYTWTPDYRLTRIASDGTVLFDTAEPAEDMENHGDRAEVREAFAKGESIRINGVRGFLHETIYNCCDNAIKYNVEGGRVEAAVFNSDRGPVVSVKDTGIGIPFEYQSRIFERFFRVGKSRSIS